MSTDPGLLRSEGFEEVGSIIQRDASILTERWCQRAKAEQPQAKRVHHDVLRDDMVNLLWAMGSCLAETAPDNGKQQALASVHGEQRWNAGWSLGEVVQDYLILRLVILEYLEESLERSLSYREIMAVGLAIDEAITASVDRYVRFREQEVRRIEREHAHQELRSRAALDQWKHIFENAGWGVAILERDDKIIRAANRAFAAMHGYDEGELVQTSLLGVVAPESRTEMVEHVQTAAARGHHAFETVHVHKDGRRFPVLCDLTLIRNVDGQPYWAANYQDITERRTLEESLRRQTLALIDSDRRKDEFLATLAHELRNPLSPILHAVEMLGLVGPENPAVKQVQGIVERQVLQITRLVDDLLDLTRISQSKLELRKEWIDLGAVIAQAVQTCAQLIETRRHRLSIAMPPVPLQMEADPARLLQVLANLLTNAAKYTDPGGEIHLTGEEIGGEVVIRVRDTGVGIDPDMLGTVFDMFRQIDYSAGRRQGGLGIGLTLVRSLVEMHGGTVRAFSEGLGHGSELVVRLPLGSPPQAATEADSTSNNSAPRRILLVEDGPDTRNLLRELLTHCGHKVEVAEHGPQGVEMARAWRPDVALVDIGLPGLDGYQVAQAIREACGADVFLVALTGYGKPEDRSRALDAGFNAHLVKPIKMSELTKLLDGKP